MVESTFRATIYGLLYRRLHQYPQLSRRLAFTLLGAPERFVEHRTWIMTIDALLSAVRLTGTRPGWAVAGMLAPLTLGGSLLVTGIWASLLRRLDRLERHEALRNLLRAMEAGRANAGSARMLCGRITVGHSFLRGRPGGGWTKARRNRARRRAQIAMAWLQSQAAEYSATLQFRELELGDIELDLDQARLAQGVDLSALQLLDAAVWRATAAAGLEREPGNCCVIVHGARDIWQVSFARPALALVGIPGATAGATEQVEYAVVSESDDSATHAHELLHLFGADDQYARGLAQQFKQRFLAHAIMFSGRGRLSQRVVSGTTAQLVGWR